MYWRATTTEDAARRSSKMERRDHFKNAASLKSLKSRGNKKVNGYLNH